MKNSGALRPLGFCGLAAVAALSMLVGCASDDGGSTSTADTGAIADATTDTGSEDATKADTGGTDAGVTDAAQDTGPGEPDVATTDAAADTGSDTAADTGADAGPQVVCGTGSPTELAACVDQQKYVTDLEAISGHRPTESAHWQEVQDLCATRLEELGFQVERQPYGNGVNVIGTLAGKTQPDSSVLVSAHYDGVPGCPGADDNGTGVAGALEVARVLSMTDHDRTLVVACWDEEERGLLGSTAWAYGAGNAGRRIVVDFNFEMIGYYSTEPNSQTFPQGFGLLFGEAEQHMIENDWRGDFIALIADDAATKHTDAMGKYATAAGIRPEPVILEGAFKESNLLGDLRRSDHAPFWDQDYPAIMITDTSEFRNKHYHCNGGVDAVDTLDHGSAAKVIAATIGAAAEALVAGDASEGGAGRPAACNITKQDCPGGKKCALTLNGVGIYQATCVDPPADPVGKGEECVRPTNAAGIDTCGGALYCSFWAVPVADPVIRKCLSTCLGDADCDAGEACVQPGKSAYGGVCMPTCDPFAQACGAELGCTQRLLSYEDGTTVYACDRVGSGQDGAPCDPDFFDCAADLACAVNKEAGTYACRPYCDAAHPCVGANVCSPSINPGPKPGIGACWPQ